MSRAIAYLRVSTESQLDGYGFDIQDDSVHELAAATGLELAATYRDEGICGAEGMEVRRALAAALTDLAAHPGTTLIVPRLDRLARDLMIQESVLADCWKTGATVMSCSETERAYCHPDNPEDPARTLIRQVLGAVAAYERAMIRLRLVRGRRRRLAETGWAGGPVPYGYCDEDERALLGRVTARRADGVSWRALADELNAAGALKRNGRPWTHQELHAMYTKATRRVSPDVANRIGA